MGFPSPTFTIIVFPFLRFFISFQCLYKKCRLLQHKNIKVFFFFSNNNETKINSVKNSREWICMHTKSAINYSLGLEKFMLYFTPIIRLNTSVYPFLFQQNLNFGFGSMHALDMLLSCLLLTIISLNFAKSFDVSANKFERISKLMFVSQTQ